MNPDLEGMRAFVAAAEELHFGRAAARLFLTQQALSKRVRRLEEAVGGALFRRTTRSVELTDAGRRFVGPAREAVAAYDAAVAVLRKEPAPLRIDVNAERFTPSRLLREALERLPGVRVETSMRQGLAIALPALLARDLDAVFGRVHDLGRPWPEELRSRRVHVEPLHAFVYENHPLARKDVLRLADLRQGGIAMPDPGGAQEWRGYLTRLCEEFGIGLRWTTPAVGVRDYGEQLRRETEAVAVGEAGMDLPQDLHLRQIPLVEPTPLHVWSLVWRSDNRDPRLARLLKELPEPAIPTGDVWLPAPERRTATATATES